MERLQALLCLFSLSLVGVLCRQTLSPLPVTHSTVSRRSRLCAALPDGLQKCVKGHDVRKASHSPQSTLLVYTAPHNGRKYMATVMGLADDASFVYKKNASRLPTFRQAWERAWPGLNVRFQPTFLNHENLRGYGLTVGYYLAMTESLLYLRAKNGSCDYHLFLEDDGLPYANTTWPSQAPTNDLDARLDELEAVNGTALIMGGHQFKNFSRSAAAAAASRPHGGIVRVGMGYGSFAILTKCSVLAFVAERLHAHLRVTTGVTPVFEDLLWDSFRVFRDQGAGTGPYVSAPLLVDHAPGFSATYRETRTFYPEHFQSIFW